MAKLQNTGQGLLESKKKIGGTTHFSEIVKQQYF